MYDYWMVQYRNNGSNHIKTKMFKKWRYSFDEPLGRRKIWGFFYGELYNNALRKRLREKEDPRVKYYYKHGYGLSEIHNRNFILVNAWRCDENGVRICKNLKGKRIYWDKRIR